MIKKIIACLTICFIITGILSPVFSDASALPQPNWSDPGISEIINISDLTGWMLNGGTFDVSTYTDSESFMNDYFNARTKTRLISPGEAAEDYYEVLPGFGINNQLVASDSFARPLDTNRVIASSFRDHTGYGRRLSNEVNDALLSSGHLYDTKIPLLNEIEFANFVNYNHDALKLYSQFFTNISGPIPPDEYALYINTINGQGFSNYLNYYSQYTVNGRVTPEYWSTGASYWRTNIMYDTSFQNASLSWEYVGQTLIYNLYITTYPNGSCSYSISFSNEDFLANFLRLSNNSYWNAGQQYNFGSQEVPIYSYVAYEGGSAGPVTWNQSFNNLDDCFKHLAACVHNINIYVDNEAWSIVDNSYSPITPEFPDAVGGEDLPTTTWPIFRPRAPYYTNVPGVLQAIEDAIADDGELDIDDLKPYLTDANGDPVPDPIFDPEPVPIPVPDPVNPDVVPGLPLLPAMPPEMPGFNGVSVLAEIINFTNQSLPTSLIVTFWGIVFGIVILGLIKILHK